MRKPLLLGNAGGNRSQVAIADGFLYVSGVRGTNPATGQQVPGPGPGNSPGASPNANARIIQIYENIQAIVAVYGLTLADCLDLTTYLTSAAYIGPTASIEAFPQFWGDGPFPTRTHVGCLFLSGSDTEAEFPGGPPRGDIVEVTATFKFEGLE